MSLGVALGEGKTLEDVLGSRRSVSEGMYSAAAAVALAEKMRIELPICDVVRAILAGEMEIDDAIGAILSRPFRNEAEPFTKAKAPPRAKKMA